MLLIGEVGRIPPALFLVVPAGKSAVRSMSASIAGAIVRRSSTASSDEAEKISAKALTVSLQLSHRLFMRAFISPPSLSFTAARRGKRVGHAARGVPASAVFPSSASSW